MELPEDYRICLHVAQSVRSPIKLSDQALRRQLRMHAHQRIISM